MVNNFIYTDPPASITKCQLAVLYVERNLMKTRIIKTKFWTDNDIAEFSKDARYLFLYFLTSPHINLCGTFELSDKRIKFDTGLTTKELTLAKNELQEEWGKVIFHEGWVKIVNAEKHNNYQKSPKTQIAAQRELEDVPLEVTKHLEDIEKVDSTIDTTMHSSPNKEIRNKNKEIRIKNKETFDKFWEMYPKKEKKNDSERIWMLKNLHAESKKIFSFIEKAKGTKRWTGGFIPQPTTFLNQERWKDDLSSYGYVDDDGEEVLVIR